MNERMSANETREVNLTSFLKCACKPARRHTFKSVTYSRLVRRLLSDTRDRSPYPGFGFEWRKRRRYPCVRAARHITERFETTIQRFQQRWVIGERLSKRRVTVGANLRLGPKRGAFYPGVPKGLRGCDPLRRGRFLVDAVATNPSPVSL